MDAVVVLIFIILSAIVGVIITVIFKKNPENTLLDEAATDYADGLNFLLIGEREKALTKLREAVSKNSKNIDAYLKIGDILRELGQIDRAVNVHKYLTVRSGLSSKTQHDILQSLIKDYVAARDYDKALGVINKVLAEDKRAVWALNLKLKVYEDKQEWGNAFQIYRETRKYNSRFKDDQLAEYRVKEGLQQLESGKEKEAQSKFKEAIKIYPECSTAYMKLADCYIADGRQADALKVLKEFVFKVPTESYLAFERIKELLYEGGVYGEIENLYLEILERQPDNLMAMLALAENYEKKGELQKAFETSLSVLEKDAANTSAKKYLVKLYHKTGSSEEALRYALDLIDPAANESYKVGLDET